jgi:hypothetical protein
LLETYLSSHDNRVFDDDWDRVMHNESWYL